MKDVIQSCKYNLRIDTEAALNGMKRDVGTLRKQDVMCGIFEVKQPHRINMRPPDPDPMNHPKVVTQMLSQMIPLRTLFGVKNVYGILTTYSSWRFFQWKWSEEDEMNRLNTEEPSNQTKTTCKSRKISPKPYKELDDGVEEEEGVTDAEQEVYDTPLNRRVLFASEVIPAGPKALRTLAWVLGEMNRSPIVPAHKREFLYAVEKNGSEGYERFPHSTDYYKGQMPHPENTRLYVLEELGHRYHGRVFRAMSQNGNLCILKYFVQPQRYLNKSEAEKSAEYWNRAYSSWLPRASAGRWGGGDAVLMSDLETMSLEVERDTDFWSKLKYTMQTRFFDKELWHGDPAWRNVALVRNQCGDISKVCMIDLEPARMIERSETSKWADFDSMWEDFRERLVADWEQLRAIERMAC